MKTFAMILALAVAGPLTFTACDRTVTEKTTTTDNPGTGTTKVEKKEVVQHNDGTVTEQHEKTVTNNP